MKDSWTETDCRIKRSKDVGVADTARGARYWGKVLKRQWNEEIGRYEVVDIAVKMGEKD